MWSPPMCTLRSGLRACRSNSRGAFATCSSTKSGSSLTSLSSTSWPAWRKSSSASSWRNSIAELGDDPPPAAVERGHGLLGQDLVARHLVDQHGASSSRSRSSAASRPASPISRTSSGSPSGRGGALGLRRAARRSAAGRARRRACSGGSSRRAARDGGRGRARARRRGRSCGRGSRSGSRCPARGPSAPRRPRSSAAPSSGGSRRASAPQSAYATTTSSPPAASSTAARIRSGRLCSSGGTRAHVEVPAAPRRDRVDVERERSAGDDRPGHAGNASWSMNRSLKSARPGELDVVDLVEHGTARRHARSPRAPRSSRPRRPRSRPSHDPRQRQLRARGRCGRRSPPRGTSRTSRRAAPARSPRARCRGRGRGSSSRSRSTPSRTAARARRAARGRRRRGGRRRSPRRPCPAARRAARRRSDPSWSRIPAPTSSATASTSPEPQRPIGSTSPITVSSTSPSRIFTPSIAPSAARMPQRICAASNAGPAGAAVASARPTSRARSPSSCRRR